MSVMLASPPINARQLSTGDRTILGSKGDTFRIVLPEPIFSRRRARKRFDGIAMPDAAFRYRRQSRQS
jgi:hypothetical protein